MAGGNKKKKRPAANPARAVATTSIQSRSKADTAPEEESTDISGTATPQAESTSAARVTKNHQKSKDLDGRELHELTPEELETQLEQSELQQFVDKYGAKVRKDAARTAVRLQTDKRLLRGQADFLSIKDWLPDELMLQVLDYTRTDLGRDNELAKKPELPTGDDLTAKVWNLRLCLLALDIPLERVHVLCQRSVQHPPLDDPLGQPWGLSEALEWLALQYAESDELTAYDTEPRSQHPPVAGAVNEPAMEEPTPAKADRTLLNGKQKPNERADAAISTISDSDADGLDVSDIDSDIEPDELLQVYMRTKEALYYLNPAAVSDGSKKSKQKPSRTGTQFKPTSGGETKLREKLHKIESDVLFDRRDADALWASRKADVAREAAERKKLQLPSNSAPPQKLVNLESLANGERAQDVGSEPLQEPNQSDDDDNILGGMFDALPGVSETLNGVHGITGSDTKVLRDFGKFTGMLPKRVLEETCRSRDAQCVVSLKQVSNTTYHCRHTVVINWSKRQDIFESTFMPSVVVNCTSKHVSVTMQSVATPDIAQSEGYVATAALFLLCAGSPKEEKSHLRLPPAFRNLWDEFLVLKREYADAQDRQTVKELRTMVEDHARDSLDVDNEVVFNASSRFRSGYSTPITRPATPKSGMLDTQQGVKDMWARVVATQSYQEMLTARMSLPMYLARNEALEMISKHQITIVVGDTGSGKSTQVPQFILDHQLSQGLPCRIYCTEPRRISAISLAHRVSDELGENRRDFGTSRSLVGYAVRLDSQISAHTRLIYATVGIVLRMLESDDGLRDITHLCLDEVHERSIDSDFLLIVLRSLLVKRPDLKVVLMSATVDAQKFSNYLDGAPIITVPGRTFPVEARFLEDAIELTGHTNEDAAKSNHESDDIDELDRQDASGKSELLNNYSKATINTLANYDEYRIDHALIFKLLETIASHPDYARFSKAVLVFLPGIAEIRQLNDMLLGHPSFSHGWRVHALHSTFSSEEQQAAFDIPPHGMRKIVLATNIAETGITIPDVTCVIDTGKHREMRFDERRQMSRLIQSFIARANAKQRRGRAGRVQEGICFHLFTKHRFEEMMVDQQTPEMLRLSLQDLVMRVKICKLGEIEQTLSQALDPPSAKNIRRAIDALIEVDALTPSEQLTPLGHQLAKLPLDAQLGKLILFGATFGCLDFTLTAAAAMGAKSPFLSPMQAKKQADSVRLGFKRGDSDLLTLYNAYITWRKVCTTPGLSEFTFCRKNFLSPQNLANIEDLKAQLLTSLVDSGFVKLDADARQALMRIRPNSRQRNFVSIPSTFSRADDNDLMASSVVAWAFYPKIIKQEGKGWRNIANNQSLGLHPTSVNKSTLSSHVKYLSFYSIMQSASRFTNAQETSPVSDFALVLLAGEAIFHLYAGVIVVDGNRLRFKVRDWKTMLMLKTLRTKLRDVMAKLFKNPGRDLTEKQRKWMVLVERLFHARQG